MTDQPKIGEGFRVGGCCSALGDNCPAHGKIARDERIKKAQEALRSIKPFDGIDAETWNEIVNPGAAKDAKIAELESDNKHLKERLAFPQSRVEAELKEKIAALEAYIKELQEAQYESGFTAIFKMDKLEAENAALKEELKNEYLMMNKVKSDIKHQPLLRTFLGKPVEEWFDISDRNQTLREEVERLKATQSLTLYLCEKEHIYDMNLFRDCPTCGELATANREIESLRQQTVLKCIAHEHAACIKCAADLEDKLSAASIQIGELRGAIEPFAKMYDAIKNYAPDSACKKAAEILSRTHAHYALKSEVFQAAIKWYHEDIDSQGLSDVVGDYLKKENK